MTKPQSGTKRRRTSIRPLSVSPAQTRRSPPAVPIRQTFNTNEDIADALQILKIRCPMIHRMVRKTGVPNVRRYQPGFAGLARIVIGQQLSTASARAIHGRLTAIDGDLSPSLFLDRPVDTLKDAGLSAAKCRTLTGLAEAVTSQAIDLTPPHNDEATITELRTQMLGLHGIGPWTADIYEMFCLGRADAFAPGDLALREALRRAMQLDERPTAQAIVEIAESWRPLRAAAALLLWAYHATGDGKS